MKRSEKTENPNSKCAILVEKISQIRSRSTLLRCRIFMFSFILSKNIKNLNFRFSADSGALFGNQIGDFRWRRECRKSAYRIAYLDGRSGLEEAEYAISDGFCSIFCFAIRRTMRGAVGGG